MNTTTFHYSTNVNNFASDVATAVRKLIASLFAKKPAAVAGEEVYVERAADETIWWLSSTANDVDAHSPSPASELRYTAARA